jgi:hypothetical protein
VDCLNVDKTPAQSHRHDQKHGDHTEISEPLPNGRMLPHLGLLFFHVTVAYLFGPFLDQYLELF